jgi:hypothetical protein
LGGHARHPAQRPAGCGIGRDLGEVARHYDAAALAALATQIAQIAQIDV